MGQGVGFGTIHQTGQFPLLVVHTHQAQLQGALAIAEGHRAADANPAFSPIRSYAHLKQGRRAVHLDGLLLQPGKKLLCGLAVLRRNRPCCASAGQFIQPGRDFHAKSRCQLALGVEQLVIGQRIFTQEIIPLLKGVRADEISRDGGYIHPPDNLFESIHRNALMVVL